MEQTPSPAPPNRRHFLAGTAIVALGAAIELMPVVSGLAVLLNPLRRRSSRRDFLPVTSLKTLPADGLPRKFPVIADRVNAWTRIPHVAIGAVFLRRGRDDSVQAFNVLCPHAGCHVNLSPDQDAFLCPCHASHFELSGRRADDRSPSPRGLDELDVEVKPSGQILVKFQNFLPGVAEKIPVS